MGVGWGGGREFSDGCQGQEGGMQRAAGGEWHDVAGGAWRVGGKAPTSTDEGNSCHVSLEELQCLSILTLGFIQDI